MRLNTTLNSGQVFEYLSWHINNWLLKFMRLPEFNLLSQKCWSSTLEYYLNHIFRCKKLWKSGKNKKCRRHQPLHFSRSTSTVDFHFYLVFITPQLGSSVQPFWMPFSFLVFGWHLNIGPNTSSLYIFLFYQVLFINLSKYIKRGKQKACLRNLEQHDLLHNFLLILFY